MTEFECGCRIMSDVINLNKGNLRQPSWNYLMKTFVNICGKCGEKQMKFQFMENKLLEMEKQRMEMFMNYEEEDEEKQPEPKDEEYESDDSQTQRMKRLQWIQDNRKPRKNKKDTKK